MEVGQLARKPRARVSLAPSASSTRDQAAARPPPRLALGPAPGCSPALAREGDPGERFGPWRVGCKDDPAAGGPVCLVFQDPVGVALLQINKSDKNDAEGLAQIVRTG
jgi:hypothetical protein